MIMQTESFRGKSTSIGNSNGFRFDASLFKLHPEFFGEVRGTIIAPGQMLVSVVSAEAEDKEEASPVMQAFLAFLGHQMVEHPDLIEPVDEAQMQRIAALVEGVETD